MNSKTTKKYFYKSKTNNKKSFDRKKKKKSVSYKKKRFKKLFCFFIMIKFIFLFFLFCFHLFCNNYQKKILDNFYKKRLAYIKMRGRRYNESNLITFVDKINWLAIHDVTKLKINCADKILIHEYSKRVLKKDICNKILKIYDNPEQINIDELPEKFVLKANHGSNYNIIVTNRTGFDINKAKKSLSKWLEIDYGNIHKEMHYSFIKRKVFAEEYIGKDLNNYKFFCYNGIPRYVYIHQEIDNKK